MKLVLLISALLLCASPPLCAQEQLTIAAAADLQPVLQAIVTRFEKETGSKAKITFGSSGNFFAQLQNGAPFDVFLSADVEYPKRLEGEGLTEPGSLYEYATGKLVLWVPNNSIIDVDKGLSAVADPAVRRLAVANPLHAPYGRAAEAALKNTGLWQVVSSKLVFGENISQTAQFAYSGNADAAILALSLVLAPTMKDKGRYFVIAQQLYPPLRQAAVILKNSAHKSLAARFIELLKRPETRHFLMQYGFGAPENPR